MMAKFNKKAKPQQASKGTRGKWPPTFKLGVFTSRKIRLQEAAINNVVLRVSVDSIPDKLTKRGRPPGTAKKISKGVPAKAKKVNHVLQPASKTKDIKSQTKPKNTVASVRTGQYSKTPPASPNQQPKSLMKVKNKLNSVKKTTPHININRSNKVCKKQTPKLDFKQCSSLCGPQSKLTLDFAKLSQLVYELKLPSPTWKVQVMMNHDLTMVLKFTNKPLKSVTFSQPSSLCNIVMNDVSVILLGCPKIVNSLQDLEILLEIVDRLDLKDCMVATFEYV